jgi:hypothetical protein
MYTYIYTHCVKSSKCKYFANFVGSDNYPTLTKGKCRQFSFTFICPHVYVFGRVSISVLDFGIGKKNSIPHQ